MTHLFVVLHLREGEYLRLDRFVEPPSLSFDPSTWTKWASLNKANQTCLIPDDEPEGDLVLHLEGERAKFLDGYGIPDQVRGPVVSLGSRFARFDRCLGRWVAT